MDKPRLGPELSRAAQLLQNGRPQEAEAICREVMKRNRRDVDALQMLGLIESRTGHFDRAARYFERGLRIQPESMALRCGLGRTQVALGAFDAALETFDRALQSDPEYPPALFGKADALEHVGRFDDARALLAPAVEAGREDAATAFVFATLEQRAGRHEAAIDLCEKHLRISTLSPITGRQLLFCAGKSYDALGRHDEAFVAFRQGNERYRRPFDPAALGRSFDRIIETFPAEGGEAICRSACESQEPIFVVSMPRSGSTLIEQIIAAHPRAGGAGETEALIQCVQALHESTGGDRRYPDAIRDLDQKRADRLADRYLRTVRPLAPGAARIVDKHLQNFRLLGLAQTMFPRARVIWCRRDPVAVCFSCYMAPLVPDALPYSTSLRHLGRYHREYERLMKHWQAALHLPILEVHYEDVVADQEGMSRRVIEFAGLEWSDDCLRFHETGRDVSTASYDQVRRPIYRTALARHERYAAHLDPLREALGMDGRE